MRKPKIEIIGPTVQILKKTMAPFTHITSTQAYRSGKIHNRPVNGGHP